MSTPGESAGTPKVTYVNRSEVSDAAAGVASEDQLRLLVDGVSDHAIFMLSPQGLVLTWNAGAQRMKGYTASEVVGRHFSLFYTPRAIQAGHPDQELQTAIRAGRYVEEGWRVRRDGSRFWASVTITALRGPAGDLQGFGKVTRDLTERLVAGDAVQRLLAEQERVFETLAEGVVLYSVGLGGVSTLEFATSAACDLLGVDEATLFAMSSGRMPRMALSGADGQPLAAASLPYAVTARTGESIHDFVWGCSHHGTQWRWLSSNSRAILDKDGVTTGVVFSLVDITERHDAERALSAAHARFSALVEHSEDVICILDADSVVPYTSPAYLTVYGENPGERLGRRLSDRVHPEDRARFVGILRRLAERSEQVATVECRIVHPDGEVHHLEVTAANHLADAAVGGIVTNSRDVTERVETATRLAHQAMHDTLTGLANRALLLDRVTQALARGRRSNKRFALLFIDLDHFKRINDSLGHGAGDDVLVIVAERLVKVVRPSDTIARLGGDEFVVLTEEGVDYDSAQLIAERVRGAVNQPVELHGQTITVDCSVGITLSDSSRPEVLLQQADSALYRAKERGRGRWELYDQAMRQGAQRLLDTEALLRRALSHDGIVVHYQPIVSLPSGAWVGSEALVRILDHKEGLIQPDGFISVAEDTGLIVPLGLEVLHRACEQQVAWAAAPHAPASMAVNLSGRQLHSPHLVDDVTDILTSSGLPADALCLELTESTLLEADNSTRRALRELTDMGIALALDDFGTGMSSLAHLRHFPVTILKVDRSFVSGLGRSKDDTEVVKAVVGLGRALGLSVVAEGVETRQQAHILSGLGCPEAQGYLYGRPAPATTQPTLTGPDSSCEAA